MKKPAVRSRWGSVSKNRARGSDACVGRGRSSGEVIEAEVGVGVQEGGDQVLVLEWGDRARRVDKHAARTEGARRRPRGSPPARAPSRGRPPASPASAGRRAPAACPAPSTAGRPARGRTPSLAVPGGVSDLDANAARTHALRGAHQRARAARVALDRHHLAPALHQRREVGVLPPGAAHRSSTRSPGAGRARARRASRRATAPGTRRPDTRPSRERRMGPRSPAPRAAGSVVSPRTPGTWLQRRRVGDQRVHAQRHLAGSLS